MSRTRRAGCCSVVGDVVRAMAGVQRHARPRRADGTRQPEKGAGKRPRGRSGVPTQSLVTIVVFFGDACPIPVARNVWQQVVGGRSRSRRPARLIMVSGRGASTAPGRVSLRSGRAARRRLVEPGHLEVAVKGLGHPMVSWVEELAGLALRGTCAASKVKYLVANPAVLVRTTEARLGVQMDPDGARRLNRSSLSCLNSGAQQTDFFHGLVSVCSCEATPQLGGLSAIRCGAVLRVDTRGRPPMRWGLPACNSAPRSSPWSWNLHTYLGVPLAKVAHVLKTRFGLSVTPGGLAQVLHRPTYTALCEQISEAPVVTPDETGWRVGALRHWLWVFATPETTRLRHLPVSRVRRRDHHPRGRLRRGAGARRMGALSALR